MAIALRPVAPPAVDSGTESAPSRRPNDSSSMESLAERLAEEMKAAWRSGQRPVAEDFLTRHPELYSHPDDALRLIHEEICLRQEFGLEANSVAIVNRFPQWQAKLRFLLDCRSLFRPNPDASAAATALRAPETGVASFAEPVR